MLANINIKIVQIVLMLYCALVYYDLLCDDIVVNGIEDKLIVRAIKSAILSNRDDIVLSDINFNSDIEVIRTTLENYGYLDANISYTKSDLGVIFDVQLNQRYRIGLLMMHFVNSDKVPSISAIQMHYLTNIEYDSYFTESQITSSVNNIVDYFKNKGYIFAQVKAIKIDKDISTKRVKIKYSVDLGDQIRIGKTNIHVKDNKYGIKFINFINNRILWEYGEIYDENNILDTRDTLMNTDLFRSVDISLLDSSQERQYSQGTQHDDVDNKIVDIDLNATLLPPNKLNVLAIFDRTDYLTGELVYRRYNIDSSGGFLQINTKLMEMIVNNRLSAGAQVYLRDYFGKQRDFGCSAMFQCMDENRKSFDISMNVVYKISRACSISYGAAIEFIDRQNTVINTIISLPVIDIFYNGVPKIPGRYGFESSLAIGNHIANGCDFVSCLFKNKLYIPISNNTIYNVSNLVLGLNIGRIFGMSVGNVVSSEKLFYAGGGDSIRGYGKNMVGPLDANNRKSKGGTSIYEISVEPRFRISRHCEFLCFVDAGNIEMSKPFIGIGAGARFITKYCVFNLSIAFPTKIRKYQGRRNIDALWQFQFKIESC